MKSLLVALCFSVAAAFAAAAESDGWTPIEKQVADVAAGSQVTIVHFWAPWCPNCNAELAKNGWRDFITLNRDVNIVFVTIWNKEDGKPELAKAGIADQANFQLLHHPNPSKKKEERVNRFLGQPLEWIPTTWVFREGKLKFALNYGEVRFPLLQQLVRDASDKWSHSEPKPEPKKALE